MARHLLHTNTAIAALLSARGVLDRMAKLPVGDVAISSLTYCELLAGAAGLGDDRRLVENLAVFSENIDILPFDGRAAEVYGRMMQRLDSKRRRMLDRMIAAHALSLNATLVTTSVEDCDDFAGLKVELWPL